MSQKTKRPIVVEMLPSRRLFAAVAWDGGGDGVNWDSRNNWSTNQLPGSADDVTINVPAADPTIVTRTNISVKSLTSFETLRLSYPGNFTTFTVSGQVNLSRELQLENVTSGGTWNGPGQIRVLNSAALMANPTAVNCDVVFDNNASFTVDGNFVFNGTMRLGTPGSPNAPSFFMDGQGPRSITGTGTFVFEGTEPTFTAEIINNTTNPSAGLGNDLSFGAGIKVVANGTGRLFNNFVGSRIFFAGSATAATPTSRLVVNNSFVNTGMLRAASGGFIGLALDQRSDIGNLVLDAGGLATLTTGPVLFGPPNQFNVNRTITVPASATLALGGIYNLNSDLDVSGTLLVDYSATEGTPFAAVRAKILTGYAGGAWNGPGIRSAAAAGNSALGLGIAEASEIVGASGGAFAGLQIDGTTVVVKSALLGDANLDGAVNIADFAKLAAHFNQTGQEWTSGDSNYDGQVNVADFARLASNFGQTLSARPYTGSAAGLPPADLSPLRYPALSRFSIESIRDLVG